MDAVVLVGGEGTRLRPLTYEIPKQMLPVVERPMIVHVLEWLAEPRRRPGGALARLPRRRVHCRPFPTGEIAGVALAYAVEPEPLDTAGAVRFAADQAGVNDTFLVLNGDVLTDFDASALVAFHRSRRRGGVDRAHARSADPSAFGVVPTDDGRAGHGLHREAAAGERPRRT